MDIKKNYFPLKVSEVEQLPGVFLRCSVLQGLDLNGQALSNWSDPMAVHILSSRWN